jgi:hypothetical protein
MTRIAARLIAMVGAQALVLIRVALCLIAVALVGVGMTALGGGMDRQDAVAATALPASTPAPALRADDGFASHRLFHEAALLDTRQIDDLRADPEGQCFVRHGVMTPAGVCVDGVKLWQDETNTTTWNALRAAGYTRVISCDDVDCLWIPAEMLVLNGEGGDEVLAVNLCAPLTARS